ncbi:hypothetical protein [Nonomuraea rubra]|uniref:hypothetical protein n=1 Tax=Nonomuraea rubra TaxID=46180 RepID=UPI003CD07667
MQSWNPQAAKLFGWSTEEAVGRPADHPHAAAPARPARGGPGQGTRHRRVRAGGPHHPAGRAAARRQRVPHRADRQRLARRRRHRLHRSDQAHAGRRC